MAVVPVTPHSGICIGNEEGRVGLELLLYSLNALSVGKFEGTKTKSSDVSGLGTVVKPGNRNTIR